MPSGYPTVNSLKNKLDSLLSTGKSNLVFPGASAGFSYPSHSGRKRIIACSGRTSVYSPHDDIVKKTFFDLASLTKALTTTLAVLSLLKKKAVGLDHGLDLLLERKIPKEKKDITLFHLLNHCSGLPSYKPFYKENPSVLPEERKKNIIHEILSCPLQYQPGKETVYSDLGFILLGRIVEIKSGKSLDRFYSEEILKPLRLEKRIFFNSLERLRDINPLKYAATEICPWRKRMIQGEVHDENTCFAGGVSGQAGLFGDAESVLKLTDCILDMWKGRKQHPNIDNSDLRYFLEVPGTVKDSNWALGFDTPAPEQSSAGRLLSRKSVGHLGFTGTSFWIDPERDLAIVLLTNRIHPGRENNRIREYRPFFHDEIVSLFS